MTRTEKATRNLIAYELGGVAFKAGKKCVPAHDSTLMRLCEGNKMGESTSLLKAWLKGWTTANLQETI